MVLPALNQILPKDVSATDLRRKIKTMNISHLVVVVIDTLKPLRLRSPYLTSYRAFGGSLTGVSLQRLAYGISLEGIPVSKTTIFCQDLSISALNLHPVSILAIEGILLD